MNDIPLWFVEPGTVLMSLLFLLHNTFSHLASMLNYYVKLGASNLKKPRSTLKLYFSIGGRLLLSINIAM